jgi:beta-lactamase superfamily II metal-dependent hydrolase
MPWRVRFGTLLTIVPLAGCVVAAPANSEKTDDEPPDTIDVGGQGGDGGANDNGLGGAEPVDPAPPDGGGGAAPIDDSCTETDCDKLSIFVVDIGQGDATVILGPTQDGRRRTLVMDAGNRYPDGGAIVGDLLVEQGVQELDYVVLSHFDGDHIGGFVTISSSTSLLWHSDACEPTLWFPTQAIFDQGTDTNNSNSSLQWGSCVPSIAASQSVAHHAVEGGAGIGTVLDLGPGYWATIVAGDGYVIDQPDRVASVNTPNERSIALLVSGDNGFDFLVTGDLIGRAAGAENAKVEGALGAALQARGIDVEVLRAGHHGAANASAPEFVAAVAPEIAIISTGDNQSSSYQHPRCDTYASFDATEVGLVLQTELGNSDCADSPPIAPVVVNGTILIEVSGDAYSVQNHGAVSPANGGDSLPLQLRCTSEGC